MISSIENEKNITREQVVDEGKLIYKKIKDMIEASTPLEKIQDKMLEEHKDFSSLYVVVVDYMLLRLFDAQTFDKWLQYISTRQKLWRDEEYYFEDMGNYAKMVQRHFHPKTPVKDLNELKIKVKNNYWEQRKKMKKVGEDVIKEFRENQDKFRTERKEKLKDLIAKNKENFIKRLEKMENPK